MDRLSPDLPARPESRRWSVIAVLAVAVLLALVAPLAQRALGQGASGQDQAFTTPGCGIAPWTGTCTCRLTPNGASMDFTRFSQAVRVPTVRPRIKDPDLVVANARRDCRLGDASAQAQPLSADDRK